jgi:hypothetical protein
MKWCCGGLKTAHGAAGERSIAVLFGRDSEDEPEFLLQARAFDVDSSPPPDFKPPAAISLVIDQRIQFCPWCGTNLEKWYSSYLDELHRPGLRIPRG